MRHGRVPDSRLIGRRHLRNGGAGVSPAPRKKSSGAPQPIEALIHVIRGQKVMLDSDLAHLYEIPTKAFNQAVRRNLERFPEDFAFHLSKAELEQWRSQIVASNPSAKMGLRRPPFVFTQEGVAMLSAVLRSDRAVQMSIAIVRTFVRNAQADGIKQGNCGASRKARARPRPHGIGHRGVRG